MLSLKQFLAILKGRRREIALIWAAVIALAVTASLLLPKQYTATAMVVLDIKAPELFSNPNQLSAGWIPGYVATQVDVLQSERVMLRAIRKLGLERDPMWRDRWESKAEARGDFEYWLTAELQRKLSVKPSRESNAIYVAYTARDARFAADLTNAIVRGYVETTVDMRNEPTRQFSLFFDERAKKLREELEAAQARLSKYQRDKGILAKDERLDIETARLNELSSQLVAAQSMAADARSRRDQASADPSRSLEVFNNPIVATLTADLNRQQTRLQELTSRLGEEHPQVIETRASIGEIRRRLASTTSQVSGGVAANDSIVRSRVAQLEASLAAQRAKVLKMKEQRDEIEVLIRDVESAQKAYDLVLARGNQTSLEAQNTQTNVSVLKSASEPPKASSPNLPLNVAIGAIVGFLVALGVAVAREMLDRRVRTAEDVVQDLRIPMLGELPDSFAHDAGQVGLLGRWRRLALGAP